MKYVMAVSSSVRVAFRPPHVAHVYSAMTTGQRRGFQRAIESALFELADSHVSAALYRADDGPEPLLLVPAPRFLEHSSRTAIGCIAGAQPEQQDLFWTGFSFSDEAVDRVMQYMVRDWIDCVRHSLGAEELVRAVGGHIGIRECVVDTGEKGGDGVIEAKRIMSLVDDAIDEAMLRFSEGRTKLAIAAKEGRISSVTARLRTRGYSQTVQRAVSAPHHQHLHFVKKGS